MTQKRIAHVQRAQQWRSFEVVISTLSVGASDDASAGGAVGSEVLSPGALPPAKHAVMDMSITAAVRSADNFLNCDNMSEIPFALFTLIKLYHQQPVHVNAF